ncbi:MAG: hypothetical protein AAGG02_01095 [Cyanobacteria bacterium P01_H01_bin.15]
MKVSEFKALVPDHPELPAELGDDDLIDQWVLDCLHHAAKVEAELIRDPKLRLFSFSIDPVGTVKASMQFRVSYQVEAE